MNGSSSTDIGSVENVKSTVSTEAKLSIHDKLDKIMEATVFQQHILLGALKAMDTILADKNSKIIKPIG